MNRTNRLFGILGIFAAVVLAGALTAGALSRTGFSPLTAFYNELGMFSGGYFVPSFAMLVNLSFVFFGHIFGILSVADALSKGNMTSIVLGFFGALTGVLAMAHGLFTLNFTQYHYIAASAFYISAALFCALYVMVKLAQRGRKPVASIAAAAGSFFVSGVYAWYMLSGGMSAYLVASASLKSRVGIEPFALVGWAALALFLLFTVLYSAGLLKRAKAGSSVGSFHIDDEDDTLDEELDNLSDEPVEESLGVGLQRSADESAEDDDHLYGL